MRQTSILALGLAAAALVSSALGAPLSATATAQAPLEAYGRLPTIEQVAISPSGQLLALDVVKGEQRTIVVEDLAADKIVAGVKVGETKVRLLQWAGDNHVVMTTSTYEKGILGVFADASEWYVATDFNIATKTLRPLLGDIDMAGNMIAGPPTIRTIDGKPIAFATGVHFVADENALTLFKIDLDVDHSSIVLDGTQGADDFLVGADGKPLAVTQYDALSKVWALKMWSNGNWKQAQTRTAAIETPNVGGLGRDGKSVLFGELVDGKYVLREVSADGSLSDPLPGPSTGEEIHDPVTHRLIGMVTLAGNGRDYHFYDRKDELVWLSIAAAFPDNGIALVSWSDDRQKLVVSVNSPTDGPGYALVDLTSHSSKWLGAAYPDLTSADISPVQPVSFTAADGLEISGYITLPNGRDPKKLPLVVFPHGGPAARDEPGFDWWAQAMASRGYAVLQVNYRGSDGFGWDFMSAGFGEWGGKMQTDLSDGVRYLAAQGTIDPAKVCIVGASYGGYAALAGATIDRGVYRCAVDVSGPADLPKLIAWGKSREGARQGVAVERYWDRFMGAKSPSDPHLQAISPADKADKVTIPILIIHGKDDSVVPFEQSQIMADALQKAGKPYEFVVLKHEDHWLSRSDTRLQMLQATMDFLEKNNPPS